MIFIGLSGCAASTADCLAARGAGPVQAIAPHLPDGCRQNAGASGQVMSLRCDNGREGLIYLPSTGTDRGA